MKNRRSQKCRSVELAWFYSFDRRELIEFPYFGRTNIFYFAILLRIYNIYVYICHAFILLSLKGIRNIFYQIARAHTLRVLPGGKWKRRKLMATPAESFRKAEIISRYQDYREKDSRTSH